MDNVLIDFLHTCVPEEQSDLLKRTMSLLMDVGVDDAIEAFIDMAYMQDKVEIDTIPTMMANTAKTYLSALLNEHGISFNAEASLLEYVTASEIITTIDQYDANDQVLCLTQDFDRDDASEVLAEIFAIYSDQSTDQWLEIIVDVNYQLLNNINELFLKKDKELKADHGSAAVELTINGADIVDVNASINQPTTPAWKKLVKVLISSKLEEKGIRSGEASFFITHLLRAGIPSDLPLQTSMSVIYPLMTRVSNDDSKAALLLFGAMYSEDWDTVKLNFLNDKLLMSRAPIGEYTDIVFVEKMRQCITGIMTVLGEVTTEGMNNG